MADFNNKTIIDYINERIDSLIYDIDDMMEIEVEPTAEDMLYESDEQGLIYFSGEALSKMLSLVMLCPKEVGWHGCGKKLGKGEYIIEDIFLYPQKTSAAHIDCDDEEYGKWQIDAIVSQDPRITNTHFHGHSHVNMAPIPSSTDKQFQNDIIEMLPPDSWYIFLIINKSMKMFTKIVDKEDNLIYINNFKIALKDGDLHAVIDEYQKFVR